MSDQSFTQISLDSLSFDTGAELNKLMGSRLQSQDGKRIVVLGQIPRDILFASAQDMLSETGSIYRPYVIHAARSAEDGTVFYRTWLVSTRDAARKLAKKYRENGGSAVIQDTRKEM